jgi:rubrerythrin
MLTFADIPGAAETKILNTALVLEHAQAQFYEELVGHLTGVLGRPGRSPDVMAIKKIAKVEQDHRDLLAILLTTSGIESPTFRFGLETLSHEAALNRALVLERMSARAYLGMLPLLPTPKHATMLASLQGTESRHATTVAVLLNTMFKQSHGLMPGGYREKALSPTEALVQLGALVS